MSKFKVPLFWPAIYREEWLKELGELFKTRWIGEADKTKELEQKFGEKFGFDYCLTTNSGTAALELAYHLIGISKGDEVLTTVLTCSATNLPVIRFGGKLTFVDINKDTLTMDYDDFAKKVNKNIKAIVVVNLGGITVDERIYKVAKDMNIPVLIDACQSLGIPEPNGDYVVFSFQAIKHFTTGDGGMLITRNQEEKDRARKLRWFGIDRNAKVDNDWKCLKSDREMCMDMEEAGYKFHMNDIAATLGLIGLSHTDEILEYRKNIANIYLDGISDKVKCIVGGSYWLFGILVENREEVQEKLRNSGIECDPIHLRNDNFTALKGNNNNLVNMDWIEPRYLYLPIHTNMSYDDANFIVKEVKKLI